MIYNSFPISDKREDNYFAGLFMGGYGAMVYALNRPDKFCMAANLSAALADPRAQINDPISETIFAPTLKTLSNSTPEHLRQFRETRKKLQIENCGGVEGYLQSEGNTWDILHKAIENGIQLPVLYFCCDTTDNGLFYPSFQQFKKHCEENNISITFEQANPLPAH